MDQKVIAWGESTGNAIKEYFNGDIIVPFTFDEAGVTEAIFSAHLKL